MNPFSSVFLKKQKKFSLHGASSEKCVLCGRDTGTSVSQTVSLREYYVEGSGQLCRECWLEVYGSR